MDDNKKVIEVINVIAEKEVCGKQFRVWNTPEEPLFLAKDVAEWLGYRGGKHASKNMCRNLNKDENVKCTAWLPSGKGFQRRTVWFVTECGLYKAIMKSKLPEAEPFQDWVCDEVLPCIRKHGFYSKEQVRLDKIMELYGIVENNNYMINGGF